MGKKISAYRLKMLFHHDLTTYAKEKIYLAALVFVPTILAYFIGEYLENLSFMLLLISLFTAIFAPYYLASHICANMRTKQDAIQFAMLPATNIEKFIVRFVDYAILPGIIVLCATIAICLVVGGLYAMGHFSEIMDSITIMICNIELQEVVDALKENLFTFKTFSLFMWLVFTWLFDMSLIVLGGCYFKRFALVKTWLIILLLSVTFGSFNILPDIHILPLSDNPSEIWMHSGILLALALSIYCVAYQLFKRKQIL